MELAIGIAIGFALMGVLWLAANSARRGDDSLMRPPSDLAQQVGQRSSPSLQDQARVTLPAGAQRVLEHEAASANQLLAEARQLKQSGRLIEAVKLVRERARLGLKEAKDVVDQL